MGQRMRIGILGGSFDPPHLGHLYLAEVVRQELNLDRVLFIPSGEPYHKHSPSASGSDRFWMTEASMNNPAFQASRIDLRRKGPTFSVDTAKELKEIFGKEARLFFIIGADNVKKIPKWKNYKTFLRLVKVVAIPRPGTPTRGQCLIDKKHWIHILKCQPLNISSRKIREELKAGISAVQYKLPPRVWRYIQRKGLYV